MNSIKKYTDLTLLIAIFFISLLAMNLFYIWQESECVRSGGEWHSGLFSGNWTYWCDDQ